MNDFEKYLQDNKEKLELDQVNPEIWLSIENKILRQKNRRNIRYIQWLSAAAAALVLLVVAVSYFNRPSNDPVEILETYGLESKSYVLEVDNKTKALTGAKIPTDRKEDFDLLLKQLEFLDAQYHGYLQYVAQNGYQEFIGNQILNYYKTKIELLDKIQQEIKKIDYYEKKYEKESPKVELSI